MEKLFNYWIYFLKKAHQKLTKRIEQEKLESQEHSQAIKDIWNNILFLIQK